VNIGTLDRPVRVEEQVVTRDPATNEAKVSWVTKATIWARVLDILPSQSEATLSVVRMSKRPAQVRTRYFSWLTANMRFVVLDDNDRHLVPVSGPAVIGRKEGMDFIAETYSTEGQGG
jgi:head-tail adaptor